MNCSPGCFVLENFSPNANYCSDLRYGTPPGKVKLLPTNLPDTLRCLQENTMLAEFLAREFVASCLKLKHQEWHDYSTFISIWKLENILDC